MSILKLKPSCKDYLWGGRRLIDEYGKQYEGEVLAETWELSCHPDGPSVIENGPYQGKTDMWYVMDAGKEAFLYYGFQKEVSIEEFARRIEEDTLLEVLHAVPVQKGDVLFIESGTIHAIGKDILIAEIQQNSNVTYRVYDYGRVGKDGKKRDLHIEKALAVTNRVPMVKDKSSYPHIADCDYFTVDKLNLDGKVMKKMEGNVSETSFASILILDGKGTIASGGERVEFQKGDSFFLSARSGAYIVEGTCDALITTIREKAAPVRIGIDIGGRGTTIGLLDVHQKLLACKEIKTQIERPAEAVIEDIGRETLKLLESQKIAIDQCVSLGISVPGTVDKRHGIVRYSNNIKWENVYLRKQISEYLPIPVHIANDADCAALGEALEGAGRECQDVVMLTLGMGVGGGVILDGEIYAGKNIGGSELGHMVIVEDGELCTCGRHGCLEAYVSTTALMRDALRATGKKMTPAEIFEGAKKEDSSLQQVLERYVHRLGIGIVNIANIFRPQLVLLGGELSSQAEVLLPTLRKMVKEGCFGGEYNEYPEIEIAALGNDAGVIGAASLL